MRLTSLFRVAPPGSFSTFAAGISAAALICSAPLALAGSATWDLDPAGGDWNNATNWTPDTVPNGPSDVATFSVSNRTGVSVAASVEVSAIDFTAGASAFNISADVGVTLTISGSGVSNASGIGQTFTTSDNQFGAGTIVFMNSATAGDGNIYRNKGDSFGIFGVASTRFFGTSNAGTSTIINTDPGKSFMAGGITDFFDQSSAANSTIINRAANSGNILDAFGATTSFSDNSTAGNAVLIAEGSDAIGDDAPEIEFFEQSTADHATITIEGGGGIDGLIRFGDTATAGNATLTMQGGPAGGAGGYGQFLGSATAGNATIVLEGGEDAVSGALLYFFDTASGGQASFTVDGTAVLDMSFHSSPGMAVGSLAGDGTVSIGPLALTIGTNNQNTEFAGTIQDGTDHTGSLVKIGTGILTLSGASSYGGGTTVRAGTLIVSNATGSGTGTGLVKVANATFGGSGIVAGPVTMENGGLLTPSAGANLKTTLTIQSILTLWSTATYTYTFKANKNQAHTDLVIANGVAIKNAILNVSGQTNGRLKPGLTLTLISNTSANPISGTFANLPDGGIVTVNGINFQASYEGGDGNDLTLTVVRP
jgi:autotransporter-associated beta strand protein